MTKTPQVKPDWNTGIYIGNGVVAEPKPIMTRLKMYLPTHWLTAIFNDDRTGFNDEDEEQYDAFIKDMNSQHCDWHELDCTDEPHFMTYHDARQYGVLACNVVTVTFAVPEKE